MKTKLLSLFLLITLNILNAQELNSPFELNLPYFQPFEDVNFWNVEGKIGMELATELNHYGTDINANGNTSFCSDTSLSQRECYEQRVNEAYGYSWELSENHQDISNNHSLKLTVHNDNIPFMGGPPQDRTRAEVVFITPNDTDLYIKWNLFIPNDDEFIETNIEDNPYHKLFQLKPDGWDNAHGVHYNIHPSNTIAALDLKYSNSSSNKRDLYFWVDPPSIVRNFMEGEISEDYQLSNRKRLIIADGIEKGVWNQIILKIKPSSQSNGYFQFWINSKPVILDSIAASSSGNRGNIEYRASIHDTNLEPFKLFSENVIITTDTEPFAVPYGLKFGHYRHPQTNTQSMYIDGLSITEGMPPFNPIYTKLKTDFCSGTLPIEDLHVECYPVPNATNYKFRFEAVYNDDVIWIDSPSPWIDLRNDNRFTPHMKYNVTVRAQGNNFDFAYGDVCDIRIPRHTKLINSFCNGSYNRGNYLSCYKIPGAISYKFKFTNSLNQNEWIDSNTPTIFIPYSSYFNGGQYEVKVREINHNYGNTSCNIDISINNNIFFNKNNVFNNKENKEFLFPNPFKRYIYLPSFDKDIIIEIYNLTGNVIFKRRVSNNMNKIDLDFLSKGVYLINIDFGNKVIHQKIIKE